MNRGGENIVSKSMNMKSCKSSLRVKINKAQFSSKTKGINHLHHMEATVLSLRKRIRSILKEKV
jgi:hypothetical protein